MVLLDLEKVPKATSIFEVDLTSLENEAKILKYKYEPVVTIRHIRQVCKIRSKEDLIKNEEINNLNISTNKNTNKSNDYFSDDVEEDFNIQANVKKIKRKLNNNNQNFKNEEEILITPKQPIKLYLQFKNFPEYLNIGDNVIINDNLIRAFGVVNRLIK